MLSTCLDGGSNAAQAGQEEKASLLRQALDVEAAAKLQLATLQQQLRASTEKVAAEGQRAVRPQKKRLSSTDAARSLAQLTEAHRPIACD